MAWILTGLEALDMAAALLRHRRRSHRSTAGPRPGGLGFPRRLLAISWIDVKLGTRMLVKYPALTAVSAIGDARAIVPYTGTSVDSFGDRLDALPLAALWLPPR